MNDLLNPIAEKVQDIVQRQGSVTLTSLELMLGASYNLVFLAIDQMASERKIHLRKGEWDYIISRPLATSRP